MEQKIKTISKEDFREKLDSGEFTLLDVRTKNENEMNKIQESDVFDISGSDFLDQIKALDKDKKYLIYCLSGARSNHALGMMEQLGFEEVYDLEGGILRW